MGHDVRPNSKSGRSTAQVDANRVYSENSVMGFFASNKHVPLYPSKGEMTKQRIAQHEGQSQHPTRSFFFFFFLDMNYLVTLRLLGGR